MEHKWSPAYARASYGDDHRRQGAFKEPPKAGEGECDDTAFPPRITETELKCNPLLQNALAPDVDSDGDGENDLLSIGFRIVRAVPVTIVE